MPGWAHSSEARGFLLQQSWQAPGHGWLAPLAFQVQGCIFEINRDQCSLSPNANSRWGRAVDLLTASPRKLLPNAFSLCLFLLGSLVPS